MTNNEPSLPHWDLNNVYMGLDSPEFKAALEETQSMAADLDDFLQANNLSRSISLPADADPIELGKLLEQVINRLNASFTLLYTVKNYVASFTTTDSYNTEAKRLMSQIDEIEVMFDQAEVTIKGWIGTLEARLTEIISSNSTAQEHAFYLQETAEQSRYLMSDPEESLAAELSLSGIRAWNKLHGTIASQLKADLELDGEVQSLPLPALQNVRRYNLDESVRRRAFDAEIKILASMREPLAACMNGVKGHVNVLNRRRGREDAVHPALDQSRIDRATLEALVLSNLYECPHCGAHATYVKTDHFHRLEFGEGPPW
jgi:oligoendopeptidase F